MYDLIIRDAQVIDGTGKAGKVLDVGVEEGLIKDMGQSLPVKGRSEIQGRGKVLAPGFVDVQNHSDTYWNLIDDPGLESMVLQGFTTVVVGQCGSSLAPLLSRDAMKSSQKWHDLSGANHDWSSFHEYAKALADKELGVNVASLIGYSTLRRGLVGDEDRKLTSAELDAILAALDRAMSEGALGLSTGLSYAHESAVSELELFEAAKVVKKYDGLLSVHLRDEEGALPESVEEVLEIARRSKVRLKISHFKSRYQENWKLLTPALQALENAAHQGVDVMFDVYPYPAIWQPLYTYLPKWAKMGGREGVLSRLKDGGSRKKIVESLRERSAYLARLTIASTSFPIHVTGRSLAKIAANFELPVEEALLKVLENGGTEILVFDECLSTPDVVRLLEHPLSVVATDGGGFPLSFQDLRKRHADKLVHPRCYGTSAEFLVLARESGKLSLERAVSKLSFYPAALAGVVNRGSIQVGQAADLVLFDPGNIRNRATPHNPYMSPDGILGVWVNGVMAVEDGRLTGRMPGNFLTRHINHG